MIAKLEAGRELDALVAERVMKLDVIGLTACMRLECGEYGVPYGGDAGQGASVQPVFLNRCFCDMIEIEDVTVFGHIASCLEVVKEYSTDIGAAWEIVEKWCDINKQRWFELEYVGPFEDGIPQYWICTLSWRKSDESRVHTFHSVQEVGNTAPLAICQAALKLNDS